MKKLIIANWKMNPQTLKEARNIFNSTKKTAKDLNKIETVVCPPFIYLSELKTKNSKVKLGGQDLFWKESGSYTGEISAKMLKNLGMKYVIIGHSERRKYLKETNKEINKEIKQAFSSKLKVIFCIGEKKRDKSKKYLNFIKKEILEGLKDVSSKDFKNLIIAYEPIWAIGAKSKGADTPENVLQIGKYIKKVLFSITTKKNSKETPILYGGSVNSKNVADFLGRGGVQGLLIGRSSINKREFSKILKISNNI